MAVAVGEAARVIPAALAVLAAAQAFARKTIRVVQGNPAPHQMAGLAAHMEREEGLNPIVQAMAVLAAQMKAVLAAVAA